MQSYHHRATASLEIMAAMLRALAGLIFSGLAVAQGVQQAASSPSELARYIETQDGLDWEALWKQLGAKNLAGITPCRAACSTEVVSLVNPGQAILIVQGEPRLFEVYLRYLEIAKGE